MSRTLIYNANLVNEGKIIHGSLVINNEDIEQLLPDSKLPTYPCDKMINANNGYLLPGIIDEHVHFRDPGLTDKADIHTESMAAAAGGVTSIMDMPNTIPHTTTLEALEQKRELMAEKCIVNYSCYFGATNTNTNLFHKLDAHKVCGIKLFMGSSTGNLMVDNMEALTRIFKETEMLITTHCESQLVINANLEKFKYLINDDDLPIGYHSKIRSSEACIQSSLLAIRLAKRLHTRLHILHVSTRAEIKFFNSLKLEDKNITGETCVGYLLFTANDYKRKGSMIKINPSLKDNSSRDALYHAINNGYIDTIATDHAPHLLSDKQGGALKAASGMPMIQFSLISMLELNSKGIFTLPTIVEKMCHAPAKLYKIYNRGFLRLGYKADLVLVEEGKYREINNREVLSKCGWTPLMGEKVHWKVMHTFVNGRQVYDGNQVDDSYRGEELYFI